jgi:hypothetical protein
MLTPKKRPGPLLQRAAWVAPRWAAHVTFPRVCPQARARALGIAHDRCHELATPGNPRIGRGECPGPTRAGHRRPAPETPDQPPALEFGSAALGEPFRHEGPIAGESPAPSGPKLGQDSSRVLPGAREGAQERAVTSPGVSVEVPEVEKHLRPERIQMLEDNAAPRPRTITWWRVSAASKRG